MSDNTAKQEKIINAAARIFAQKGFHQAKMDEIAEKAGVAKGTLYYNYSSKSKLFAATVVQGLTRIMAEIEAGLSSDLPFPDHFKSLVAGMTELYISHSEVTRIYANEMSSGIDDETRVEIQNVRQQFINFISDILETGQSKGYLKSLSPKLAALSILGIVDTLCTNYLENPEFDDIEDIIETIHTILSTGLLEKQQ